MKYIFLLIAVLVSVSLFSQNETKGYFNKGLEVNGGVFLNTKTVGTSDSNLVREGNQIKYKIVTNHAQSHTMTSTSDHTSGNWKIFASNGSGQIVEIDDAVEGKVLMSQGVGALPSWQVPWIESEMHNIYTNTTGVAISTGTQVITYSSISGAGRTDHPAISEITSHATNDYSGYCFYQMISQTVAAGYEHKSTIAIADTTYSGFKCGFGSAVTVYNPTYGVYFEKVVGTKLRGVVNVNSSYSYTATTFELTLNTWYTFYVICTDATHAQFIIKTDGGTTVFDQTIAATLPTYNAIGGSIVLGYVETDNNARKVLSLDKIAWRYNGTTTRPY